MKKSAVLIAAGVAFAWNAESFADVPGKTRVLLPEPPSFTEVDADGDQMITETEFLAFIEERRAERMTRPDVEDRRPVTFAQADTDGDGFLSQQEFEEMPRRIVHRKVKMHDPKEFFSEGDTDLDGVLNEQEFEALIGQLHMRRHPEDFTEQTRP